MHSARLPKTCPRAPAAVSAATVAVHADFAEDRVSALSQVSGVLGSQWGDEGKGKLVDVLAPRFDIVARCQVRRRESVSFPCLKQLFSVSSVLFENLVVRGAKSMEFGGAFPRLAFDGGRQEE